MTIEENHDWKDWPPRRLPHHRPGELFVKGPIPWAWLTQAARLPGKALHVAIVIWFLAGMRRKREILMASKYLELAGVKRHSAYRGLQHLEAAGLISVERRRGRSPVITAVRMPGPSAGNGPEEGEL